MSADYDYNDVALSEGWNIVLGFYNPGENRISYSSFTEEPEGLTWVVRLSPP